jgi:hypothetical protein
MLPNYECKVNCNFQIKHCKSGKNDVKFNWKRKASPQGEPYSGRSAAL